MNQKQKTTLIAVGVLAVIGWAHWGGRPDLTPESNPIVSATASAQLSTPKVEQTPEPSKVTETPPTPTADRTADLTDLVRRAITAWQSPTVDQRQTALAPLVTADYLNQATTIDPTEVPASPVATVTAYPAPDASVVDVALEDGTALTLDVSTIDGRDLVTDIRPADA